MKLAYILCFLATEVCSQTAPRAALAYRNDFIREAHYTFGIDAPVALLAGQIEHESGWNASVVAWDGGIGLGQEMPMTSKWLVEEYPDLGPADAKNATWSIRASLRLNQYNYARLLAIDDCNRWGMTLFSYNAGRGVALQKIKESPMPLVWWGMTENYPTTQSPANARESIQYPRIITYTLQAKYLSWGGSKCLN